MHRDECEGKAEEKEKSHQRDVHPVLEMNPRKKREFAQDGQEGFLPTLVHTSVLRVH